jgi:hypothetical protein
MDMELLEALLTGRIVPGRCLPGLPGDEEAVRK